MHARDVSLVLCPPLAPQRRKAAQGSVSGSRVCGLVLGWIREVEECAYQRVRGLGRVEKAYSLCAACDSLRLIDVCR